MKKEFASRKMPNWFDQVMCHPSLISKIVPDISLVTTVRFNIQIPIKSDTEYEHPGNGSISALSKVASESEKSV